MRRPMVALACAALLSSSCGSDKSAEKPAEQPAAPKEDPALKAAEEARSLVEGRSAEWWDLLMDRYPEWATSVGDHRFDDKLTLTGPKADKEWLERVEVFHADLVEQTAKLDEHALDGQSALTLTLLVRQLEQAIAKEKLGLAQHDVDQMDGPQATLSYLFHKEHPMKTKLDVENLILRYRAFTPWMDGHLESLKHGLAGGRTAPRIVVERVVKQLKELLAVEKTPEKSTFARVKERVPAELSAEERQALEADIVAATKESVLPSFKRYLAFLEKEYLPKARKEPGLGAMPGGKEAYAFLAQHYTTTTMTPEQIHELGKQELARIDAEMKKLADEKGHKGDAKSFLAALKKDKKQYAKTREALLTTFQEALKRADAKLPEAFGRLPKMSYTVEPMDKEREKDAPAAYYQPGSVSDGRGGVFVANLYRVEDRPLFNSEALAFHEAVPGHHLQIALAQELEGLPTFRKETGETAFVEGWALYAERLCDELGLYSSLEARMGYLGFAAWRAARLVVDTGIHHLGWSRKQAADFLAAHTTLGPTDVNNEIDRYIAWPGQALAYMVGALRILALREHAKQELGEGFDLKAFHDAALSAGALPLDLVDVRVARELGFSVSAR